MSLPDWLEPLPDAELMRATDRWAIGERGIPSLELMERAGEGLARVAARHVPAGRIAVVCGKGNNGGDGYVAARLLRAAGRDVDVLSLFEPGSMTPDARAMHARVPGAPPLSYTAERLESASGIVDALLGTGVTGAPEPPAAGVIRDLEAAGAPIVAADVPSGVDASTGEVPGVAVHAVATATFHRAKPGLWIAPGKQHAGEVSVIDIGIPAGAPGAPAAGLLTPGVTDGMPRRGAASTKFSSGNVVVIGGSRGLTGAPAMSALAAMRAGAGYVTVVAPAALELAFTTRLLESMFVPAADDDGALRPEALPAVLAAAGRADAVVLGPGLGRAEGTQELVRGLVARVPAPVVLDADGLNALAGHVDDLRERPGPTILTPHAGELGRLLDMGSAEIGRARLAHARGAAARTGAVVVLKGDDTLVAEPSGTVAVSPGGAPALATAGTGDVLSGVVGAMLAKGLAPRHAACAAVHVHCRAGRLAAEPHGADGVIASDVIAALPAAMSA